MTGKIIPMSATRKQEPTKHRPFPRQLTEALALRMEAQASQVEAVLLRHGLEDVRVTAGSVAPHFVRYEAQTGQMTTLDGLADEIALDLGLSPCRLYQWEGALYIEVPRNDAAPLRLVDLYRQLITEGSHGPETIPPVTAVLGLDHDGVPLLVQLPKVGPLIIAGEAGAGKTSLARTIAASLAMHNPPGSLRLALVGEGLWPFADLPHVMEAMAVGPGRTILDAVAITAGRGAPRHAEHHLVLLIDDLDRLQAREQAVLKAVLQRGLPARVHLVATVEDLSAMRVDASHFPVRLLGRGAEPAGVSPLFGRGDFSVRARERRSRMQAAVIEPEEIASLVRGRS